MSYQSLKTKTDQFLSSNTIAVIGVSHNPHEAANANYRKLKASGYNMYPVNPNYREFEGERCYAHISDLNGMVDAALIFTHPDVTSEVARECYEAGIKNIWVHRAIGHGSHSDEATEFFKDKPEVNFIDGACPMMFLDHVDWFHKCMCEVMKWTGALPG